LLKPVESRDPPLFELGAGEVSRKPAGHQLRIPVQSYTEINRVMGFLLRDDNWGRKCIEEITLANARLIYEDSTEDQEFQDAYQESARIVSDIRTAMTDAPSSPALFFKNTAVERRIEVYISKIKTERVSGN